MVTRIVMYRLGSLGDTVVALPCLHRVAQSFPGAQCVYLTNIPVQSKAAPLQAILGDADGASQFLDYPVGTRSVRVLLALRATLRALQADTLIYLTPSRGLAAAWRDVAFFRWCGFTRIVGAPLTSDLQRHRRGADGKLEMECERLARCIAPLGPVDLDDPRSWDLHLNAAERQGAQAALGDAARRPRIAVNMGGKFAINDWGEPNWSTLVARLSPLYSDHTLVFVGGPEDEARAQRVGALWSGPVVNLCGRVSPRVSAAAMAGSALFVGHDSGPLHLAACMSVTCVGLYGENHEPRKWHPYGAQHRILHDMRGVCTIGVDQVAAAVESALAKGDDRRVTGCAMPGEGARG
jgi:ADP-heptose:LPS heptosyltransferase